LAGVIFSFNECDYWGTSKVVHRTSVDFVWGYFTIYMNWLLCIFRNVTEINIDSGQCSQS
jgi:hypothetical protein